MFQVIIIEGVIKFSSVDLFSHSENFETLNLFEFSAFLLLGLCAGQLRQDTST